MLKLFGASAMRGSSFGPAALQTHRAGAAETTSGKPNSDPATKVTTELPDMGLSTMHFL